jgi:hypothetical protein
MRPTTWRTLVVMLVVGVVAGWIVTRLVDAVADRSLPVPWTAPVVMLVLALALVLWARGTRSRLARRPGTKPLDPVVAARTAALAMAGSRTGALVAGFYLGVAVALSGGWDVPYVRGLILISLATVAASVAVVAASLWLERICRLPPEQDDGTTA